MTLDLRPSQHGTGILRSPWRRVIIFVDNAGADVVLGILPLARELLQMGAEVRSICHNALLHGKELPFEALFEDI